ncbi:hypothetical protein DL98DRAFT_518931 [Cadophora sp. DSE1049]|nr:hypothetical protein DL98DRAFT_518931 [Cadophora sp. DSE1049]
MPDSRPRSELTRLNSVASLAHLTSIFQSRVLRSFGHVDKTGYLVSVMADGGSASRCIMLAVPIDLVVVSSTATFGCISTDRIDLTATSIWIIVMNYSFEVSIAIWTGPSGLLLSSGFSSPITSTLGGVGRLDSSVSCQDRHSQLFTPDSGMGLQLLPRPRSNPSFPNLTTTTPSLANSGSNDSSIH